MVNQSMIDSWQRGQGIYTQARHFTPGQQRTQYRTTERGQPKAMDLLVVIHNDAPPSDIGQQRVDLIVNSGDHRSAAEHGNGHLVNNYDEQAGITDHTALYSQEELSRIQNADGRAPAVIQDRDGGVPGAQLYGVRAMVRTNERGELVIDTAQPMSRSEFSGRYALHDVQEGMLKAQVRENTLQQQAQPSSQRQATSPPPPTAPRRGPSSQAGLGAVAGPRQSYPAVPKPGQPGSRLNPTVRERSGASAQQAAQTNDPSLITSADVPRTPAPKQAQQPRQGLSRPSAASVGRVGVGGAQGAAMGLKATAAIPHPAAKVVGAAGGAVIGGAMAAGGKPTAQSAAGVPGRADGRATPKPLAGRSVGASRSPGDDLVHFQTESGQLISMGKDRYAKKGAPDNARRLTSQEHAEARAAQPSRAQRLKDSKVGQAVQTPEFKDSAKRVGTEVVRDAAAEMTRAKQSGATGKGVAASAAKGALSGATRGVRTELANREATKRQENTKPNQDGTKNTVTGTEIVDRLGQTVKAPQDKQDAQPQTKAQQRPLSERYDYQFETPKEGPDSETQYVG